jgi:hypothetical protein
MTSFLMVLSLGFATSAFSPSFTGSTVNYFTASGTSCTSTVWPTTASDGQVKDFFTNNVGGPPLTAFVTQTQLICIQISIVNGAASTTYYCQVDNTSPIATGTTDSSGTGTCTLVWTDGVSLSSGTCQTIPVWLSTNTPASGGVGMQVNHLVLGPEASSPSSCTVIMGVPEFPLGPILLVGMVLPALFLVRKWARPKGI